MLLHSSLLKLSPVWYVALSEYIQFRVTWFIAAALNGLIKKVGENGGVLHSMESGIGAAGALFYGISHDRWLLSCRLVDLV